MSKSGFHTMSIESFKRRAAKLGTRKDMTQAERERAYSVRSRREALQEDMALRRELEGF